ncbi:hypothetical protein [Bacillus sp. OTU530]|uniref:hypothetical protein n=1 Tax=Bacillus sp. OTU530 TaxID=3043862 RepID=UPI00313EC73C
MQKWKTVMLVSFFLLSFLLLTGCFSNNTSDGKTNSNSEQPKPASSPKPNPNPDVKPAPAPNPQPQQYVVPTPIPLSFLEPNALPDAMMEQFLLNFNAYANQVGYELHQVGDIDHLEDGTRFRAVFSNGMSFTIAFHAKTNEIMEVTIGLDNGSSAAKDIDEFYQTVGTFLNWWLGLSGGTETSELLEHLGYGGNILTQDYEAFGNGYRYYVHYDPTAKTFMFSLNKQY